MVVHEATVLVPQGYAIVEYTLPSGALRGKAAVDMIENGMRPDSKKAKARLYSNPGSFWHCVPSNI